MPGIETSTQIAFPPTKLNKLQSILVTAEVACSRGDLPVLTVEARLAAVAGLATAAVVAAVPAVLAAAVVVPLKATIDAAQALSSMGSSKSPPSLRAATQNSLGLLSTTRNVKYSRSP